MRIKLAYGRDGLWVDLPDDAPVTVIEPQFVPGLPDERAAWVAALRSPEGTPPLRDLVRPDDAAGLTVAVVFSDLTRPMPNDRVLPPLLEELALAGVPDEIHLLAPATTEAIGRLRIGVLGQTSVSLDVEETLIALGISATTSHVAQLCVEKLKELHGCDVHMTHISTPGDAAGLRRLGVNVTTDPSFAAKTLSAL